MRLLPICLVACATTPARSPGVYPGGPRGLHATEHREIAREHDEIAREYRSYPKVSPMTPGDPNAPQIIPWYRSWDPATEHERLARVHRGEAAALEAEFAEACGTRDEKTITTSPLIRHRTGSWNTRHGVIVYLAPAAGSPETLLADLRCHRAWMMLAPASGMDHCPLDLPNLHVDARGDAASITLVITARDEAAVLELQRRLGKQIEDAAREERPER